MDEVADEFTTKFVAATQKLKVGNPLDAETDIAAMIHSDEQVRAQQWWRRRLLRGRKS